MTSAGAVSFARYRRVLRGRHVPHLVSAMVLGRLPNGMRPLGIVLLVHQQHGSYTVSGAALAALMIGTMGSAPFRGRAVDRWGQSRTLFWLSLAQTGATAGFVVAGLSNQGAPTLLVLAAAMGATGSTLGGSMRALWPVVVKSTDDLTAAYALQALLEDLISVAGPLVASLLLVVASPAAVLAASGVAGLAGTIAFVMAPASRESAGRRHAGTAGALKTPGMRVLVGVLACGGAVMGVLNVAVPAVAGNAAAGVLLAVMSASSVLSGLIYGARTSKLSPGRRYVWAAGVLAVMVLPLPAAGSVTQLGALLALVGLAYAPSMIAAYLLLDELAPVGALTEAYTWLVSANACGIAFGSALAGLAVQHAGIRWTLALAVLCAAVGFGVAVGQRSRLDSVPARPDLAPS